MTDGQRRFCAALEAAGHVLWRRDDGSIEDDYCPTGEGDHHAGVSCTRCGEFWCLTCAEMNREDPTDCEP